MIHQVEKKSIEYAGLLDRILTVTEAALLLGLGPHEARKVKQLIPYKMRGIRALHFRSDVQRYLSERGMKMRLPEGSGDASLLRKSRLTWKPFTPAFLKSRQLRRKRSIMSRQTMHESHTTDDSSSTRAATAGSSGLGDP